MESWDRLTLIGKDLLTRLYGNKNNYLRSRQRSSLEPYVIEFDHNIGNDLVLHAIALRIGAELPLKTPETIIELYQILRRAIDIYGLERDEELEEIINERSHLDEPFLTGLVKPSLEREDYHHRLILAIEEEEEFLSH